jgi:hypothetical protein
MSRLGAQQPLIPTAATPNNAERPGNVDKPGKIDRSRLVPEAVFAGVSVDAGKKVKAKALAEKSRAEWRAIMARQVKGKAPSADDRAALKRISEEHNAAYRALLSPTQRQQFDGNLERLRPTMKPAVSPAVATPNGSIK